MAVSSCSSNSRHSSVDASSTSVVMGTCVLAVGWLVAGGVAVSGGVVVADVGGGSARSVNTPLLAPHAAVTTATTTAASRLRLTMP